MRIEKFAGNLFWIIYELMWIKLKIHVSVHSVTPHTHTHTLLSSNWLLSFAVYGCGCCFAQFTRRHRPAPFTRRRGGCRVPFFCCWRGKCWTNVRELSISNFDLGKRVFVVRWRTIQGEYIVMLTLRVCVSFHNYWLFECVMRHRS